MLATLIYFCYIALMSSRIRAFEQFKNHPWLGRVYKRLDKADLELAHGFLSENASLNKAAFESAALRLFLDKPKPKNWTAIEELLVCANSSIPE